MRLLVSVVVLLTGTSFAQQGTVAPAPGVLGKGAESDYGPALATALELPGDKPEFIARGMVLRMAKDLQIAFDVDRLQPVAAWRGGYLELSRTNIGTYKGLNNGAAVPKGEMIPLHTAPAELRAASAQKVRYRGYYRNLGETGEEVVFFYEVEGAPVLDRCHLETAPNGELNLLRELSIGPRERRVRFELSEGAAAELAKQAPDEKAGWALSREGGGASVEWPVSGEWSHFRLKSLLAAGGAWTLAPVAGSPARDLRALAMELPPRALPATVVAVHGQRAPDSAPYVTDVIPLPDDNPWNAWLRPTGLDFFPDGRLAICTLGGDVWIASGLDDSLAKVEWKRFAEGLREPMGLRIVAGRIVVGCRDQITQLSDTNRDDHADFYECLNNGRTLIPNFHAFAYDLQTDRAGNFYFGTGGNQLGPDEPWHAKLFRVSSNGDKLEAIASGFRAPNGLTIGPDDAIYVAENQGQWIPSSKISRVKPGGFYGFVADTKFTKAVAPPSFDPPLCYLPMTWDNSSGGGAFCLNDQWGPFKGRMVHTSFGAAALFAIFEQRVGEVSQGAAIKFPLPTFESGIHRARFSPKDGQLYVTGLKGWQSRAVKDGCLARVRYTGQPVKWPTGFHVAKDALVLEFSTPVDPASAGDAQNYAAEQWNYQWHATYGSPDVSVADPKKRGRDRVDIRSAKISADGKSVTLEVPGLAPVMQMLVKMNIKSADGTPVETEIAGTINVVPE